MSKVKDALTWLWKLADGWKCFLVAGVLIAEKLFPGFQGFHYVDTLVAWLGWANVAPVIDPGQAVMVISGAVALGHKLVKAAQQIRAGVPVVDVHP